MGVPREVRIVDSRQDAPAPVYLRVVLVGLGDNQEYGDQEQGESEGCYKRVRVNVYLFEGAQVGDGFENVLG